MAEIFIFCLGALLGLTVAAIFGVGAREDER